MLDPDAGLKEKSPGTSQNKVLQYFVRSKQKSNNSRSNAGKKS
jgi:hypothetical protein